MTSGLCPQVVDFEFQTDVAVREVQFECMGIKTVSIGSRLSNSKKVNLLDQIDLDDREMEWCPVIFSVNNESGFGGRHLILQVRSTYSPFAAVRQLTVVAKAPN